MSREDERLDIGDASVEHPVAIPSELPILPLRDTVLFPNSFLPLAVARESSVRLIEEAIAGSKLVGVFTQRDASVEEPAPGRSPSHRHRDAYSQDVQAAGRQPPPDRAGAVAPAASSRSQPHGRTCARRVSTAEDILREEDRLEIDALQRNIKTNFQHVVSLSPLLSDDLQALAMNITEPGRLADFIASSLATLTTSVKQEVLETVDVRARLDLLNRLLIKEAEVLELGSKIQSQVQSEVGKNQREYFLREQLKAIQKELGEGDDQTKEVEELREKIEAAGMPEGVKKEAKRELDRLSKMPVAAAEYTVSRTYLDWLIALPWAKRTDEVIDLSRTKGVLDADHSGLEKVKDRILEYLAVRKLNPTMKGPILCFAGPSGSGEDLARQVDRQLARSQVRARVARRHARRSRNPRSPPHLYRCAARSDHSGPPAGGVEEPGFHPGRNRQARLRLPRRPELGAARSPGSGAEQLVPRSLPGRAVRSVGSAVRDDRQRARHDSTAAARQNGSARARRAIPRRRSSRLPRSTSSRSRLRTTG